MVDHSPSHNASRAQHLSVALGIAVTFVLGICISLEPQWHSNDDVALSMVAHGYGLNAVSSPNLIFSNVVWGMLVQAIPWIGNTPGYSVATLAVLVISGAVIVMALARLGTSTAAAIGLLILVLTRPVLFPQFTINAGLLAVAAVASVLVYARHRDGFCLFVACLLAFLSFLVRSLEFMFVMLVSLPLIPWRQLARDKRTLLGTAGLALAIAGAVLADKQAFNNEHWQVFNELDPVRAQFTDFGAAVPLANSPKILERHDYSPNDINLIKTWFFADPEIVKPETLKSMLDELGPLPDPARSLRSALAGIQALLHPHLLPLTLSSLLLLLLHPCRQVVAAWLCFSHSGLPAAPALSGSTSR